MSALCDCHFVGLMALNPIRCVEVVLVISKLDTLDKPFGEHLLGDGHALDLSAIGNKELGCASCLKSLVHLTYSLSALQTQSVHRTTSVWLCIAAKDRQKHICLDIGLGKEPQSREEGDTIIGKL